MKAEGSRLFGLEAVDGAGQTVQNGHSHGRVFGCSPEGPRKALEDFGDGCINGVRVHFYKSSCWLLCGESTTGGKSGSRVTSQEVMCRQDGWRPGPGR